MDVLTLPSERMLGWSMQSFWSIPPPVKVRSYTPAATRVTVSMPFERWVMGAMPAVMMANATLVNGLYQLLIVSCLSTQ